MKAINAFMVIVGIYLTATAIITMVLMIKTNSAVEDDTILYNDLKDNYSTSTLESIRISFEPCVAPFSPLFNIPIEGRKSYCHCYDTFYYRGPCPRRSYFCNQIQGKPGFNVYNYRGVYLCGLRSIYKYDNLKTVEDGKCLSNYRICGKDSSVEICYPASLPCPINDFSISNEQKPDLEAEGYSRIWVNGGKIYNEDGTVTKPNHSSSQYQSGNFYLYYTNKKTDNRFVIDFKLGYEDICTGANEEKAPVKQHDLLDKDYDFECKTSIGGFTNNPHYTKVDEINKKALWSDNNVFIELGSIPDFDIKSLDYDLGLFTRPYVHFDSKCIKKVNESTGSDYNRISFMDKLATGNKTSIFGYMIAICVLCGFYGFCSCVVCSASFPKDAKKSFNVVLLHCVCLFLIVIIVLVSILLSRHIPTYSLVKTLEGEKCGDSIVNSLASGESSNINSTYFYYIIILSLSGFGMLLYIVLCCWDDPTETPENQYAELTDNNKEIDVVHDKVDKDNSDATSKGSKN